MSKPIELSKKNILITGGSMGIGYAAAEACLKAGGRVVICARRAKDLETAQKNLKSKGYQNIVSLTADVTKRTDIDKAIDKVEAAFGPLNAVIHAAGVYGPIGNIMETDPEKWLNNININLFGTYLIARQSCLRFKKNGGGRIALFSGGGASGPLPNYSAYAASKVAIVRFTETISEEMSSYGIEVNCIAPGFVATRFHEETINAGKLAGEKFLEFTKEQLKKGGVPASKGAETAAFLISDEAKGITGKFVSSVHDQYKDWPKHLNELKASDIFTLRRILPKERGMNWQ